MDIGECGVCGQWASGTRLPSGNRRYDGTTPMDNFVCFQCQEEARSAASASNEKEISHGRVSWPSSVGLFRGGDVGFIDWLDAAARTTGVGVASVETAELV